MTIFNTILLIVISGLALATLAVICSPPGEVDDYNVSEDDE